MSAGTHTRIHGPAVQTAQTRLPWWALALPSLAFLALLTLLLAAPEARAAAGGAAGVRELLELLRDVLFQRQG